MITTFFIILWCVHILLESLPVSSSGHVELVTHLFQRYMQKNSEPISTQTDHLMHIPSLLIATVFLLQHGLWGMVMQSPATFTNWALCIIIATLITVLAYALLQKLGNRFLPLYAGFFITGLVLLSVYWLPGCNDSQYQVHLLGTLLPRSVGDNTAIHYGDAFFIGLAQGIALLPGISRLAMTVVTGLWCGLEPATAFLFSLSIECALMVGAIAKALYDSKKNSDITFTLRWYEYLLITLVSCTSYALLELMLRATCSHKLVFFGWYMLCIAGITFFIARREEITRV